MKNAIGLDIGGTKIEGILMSEKGRIISSFRTPTQSDKSRKIILSNIIKTIAILKTKNKISGIGIGIPGVEKNGRIIAMPNIKKLIGVDIKRLIENKFKTKVYLENDAKCFALAEHKFGAAKNYKNSVGLILGTGIGSGIMINNGLYKGNGYAGSFGHTTIEANSKLRCNCGKYGHFEAFCSGPSIVKRYKLAKGRLKGSDTEIINHIFSSNGKIEAKIRKETMKYLAIGIANIIRALNPEIIVLGGGLSNLNFYKELKNKTKKYVSRHIKNSVKIIKNKLGDNSGAIGAAGLAL